MARVWSWHCSHAKIAGERWLAWGVPGSSQLQGSSTGEQGSTGCKSARKLLLYLAFRAIPPRQLLCRRPPHLAHIADASWLPLPELSMVAAAACAANGAVIEGAFVVPCPQSWPQRPAPAADAAPESLAAVYKAAAREGEAEGEGTRSKCVLPHPSVDTRCAR